MNTLFMKKEFLSFYIYLLFFDPIWAQMLAQNSRIWNLNSPYLFQIFQKDKIPMNTNYVTLNLQNWSKNIKNNPFFVNPIGLQILTLIINKCFTPPGITLKFKLKYFSLLFRLREERWKIMPIKLSMHLKSTLKGPICAP